MDTPESTIHKHDFEEFDKNAVKSSASWSETTSVGYKEEYLHIERYRYDADFIASNKQFIAGVYLRGDKNKYEVYSIDPVEEFCEHAKTLGLTNVYCMKVQDINFINKFDGIWACASLLHVKEENLEKSFSNCYKALKKDGVMFCSFKYGDFIGYENDRYFIYLDEKSLKKYIGEFKIIDVMIIQDEIRKDELNWINVVLKK